MTHTGRHHDEIAFEGTDIHPRPIFWFTVALLGMTALVALGMVFLHRYLQSVAVEHDRQEARAVTVDKPAEAEGIAASFPEPRLQTDAYGDLSRLRAEEKALLGEWALLDPAKGVARIPIDEAMAIVAKGGIPVWKKAAQPSPAAKTEARP